MKAAIEAIPDGVHGAGQRSPVKKGPMGGPDQINGKKGAIIIQAQGRGENYFTPTDETSKFRQARCVHVYIPQEGQGYINHRNSCQDYH